MTGIDDKRQITAVFGDTMSGDFLPPQFIKAKPANAFLPSSSLLIGTLPSQKITGQMKKQWLTTWRRFFSLY